jgi:DtxR family Mn-dependent transcriptional regulator
MSPISPSLEDYLEAILHIVRERGAARAKDVSLRLDVKGSSVTGALHALVEKRLIKHAPYDIITLTPKGEELALGIASRHRALKDLFVKVLGVDEAEAEAASCAMEHSVSPQILERFTRFVEFVAGCPGSGAGLAECFRHYYETAERPAACGLKGSTGTPEPGERSGVS